MFRFIHTADIHLDSPLRGLAHYPNAPVDRLRGATRTAFTELVSTAIEEAVDFMVIAGDLYDGTWQDHNTGLFFCQEMGRLQRAGIPVHVLRGNHDAENKMTRTLPVPPNVRWFASRQPETVTLTVRGRPVALHGQSFKDRDTTDNLASRYPAPLPGHYNIGVLHTALEGNAEHASYAPCSLAELHARGYDYWALGHVHEHRVFEGPCPVVFPGNLQGRSIRETGRRGAVLVTVDDAGRTSVDRLLVDVLRWEHVEVDAGPCERLEDVTARVGQALHALVEVDPHVPRAVRVTIGGRTQAHGALFGREHQVRVEVLAHVAALGDHRLWLEKVRIDTRPASEPGPSAHADALDDLRTLFAEAAADPDFLDLLRKDLAPLALRAPNDLFALVPSLDAVRREDVAGLVAEVAPGLLDHLTQAE